MIRNVVLSLGEHTLSAVVEDGGVFYEARYKWWKKESGDVPPEAWAKAVYGEVDYQKGERHKAATGRPTLRG